MTPPVAELPYITKIRQIGYTWVSVAYWGRFCDTAEAADLLGW